ncbi:hypothetical protein TW83_09900 [Paracoccus sp. S4493]|uniref:hypothetical protein n=1 Tax=Paracoccus sp. S4493 TaxID=579490 RepID=UPI0005FA852D|nr:hypothetical protein [Paracoccus sp. S4493]KJZ31228.1 hypothetical protein TW83_09900 [Paracoccus sp. S4493]
MSKKPAFSLDNIITEDAVQDQPDVYQRGSEPKKRGPKPKPPRENAKKTSVMLEGTLYKSLAHHCVEIGKTQQDVIELAVREYLDRQKEDLRE